MKISKFNIRHKSLLRQGLLEPEFYFDLVYKLNLRKLLALINFQCSLLKKLLILRRLVIALTNCNDAWWSSESRLATSIAIILMGKRELVALLNLSSWCLVMVERLFLAVSRGCLQFVIVVVPDHTHYFCFPL